MGHLNIPLQEPNSLNVISLPTTFDCVKLSSVIWKSTAGNPNLAPPTPLHSRTIWRYKMMLLLLPPNNGGYVLPPFVCLFVCLLDYSRSYERILMNFRTGGAWPKVQSITFLWWCGSRSGFLDPDPDQGIFKGFFVYYCDCYRQPRVKHENPGRKFEFFECFLVISSYTVQR